MTLTLGASAGWVPASESSETEFRILIAVTIGVMTHGNAAAAPRRE